MEQHKPTYPAVESYDEFLQYVYDKTSIQDITDCFYITQQKDKNLLFRNIGFLFDAKDIPRLEKLSEQFTVACYYTGSISIADKIMKSRCCFERSVVWVDSTFEGVIFAVLARELVPLW